MKADELAQELGHPEAQKLLSGSMARLAYNGPDGFPRVIPTGFYWTGDRIVVSTATTSPKVKALETRPEVALTIDTGDTPGDARALLVRGTVVFGELRLRRPGLPHPCVDGDLRGHIRHGKAAHHDCLALSREPVAPRVPLLEVFILRVLPFPLALQPFRAACAGDRPS